MPKNSLPRRFMGKMVFFVLLSFAIVFSACNMPGRRTPTPSGFEMINTAAARTVEAQLTEISKPPAGTPAPTRVSPTTPVVPGAVEPTTQVIQAPALTVVPQPTQAPQASDCDRARFIKDVTVPDNTTLQPGASFTKTWRLRNVGQCTWDAGYSLVFVSGERLGSTGRVTLQDDVRPNDTVDLSVEMVAPTTGGGFRSEWKLSNPIGEVFGTGKNGDQPIWAQITVDAPGGTESGGYDFVSSASSASWYSAAGDNAGLPLPFNGSPDNPKGAAILADGLNLENRSTSGKALLLAPNQQPEGYVYGIFPMYQVGKGDRFKARVGYAVKPDGSCPDGGLIFQVVVRQGDDIDTLLEISETCNGSLTPIDIDLSSLLGKTVEFILAVRADGSSPDDAALEYQWGVWNSPQITNK